jgi:hypothetical protein
MLITMTANTTYNIHLGLFVPGSEPVSEDDWNLFLVEEVCPLFQSFSIRDELGFWRGQPEPVRVITIISDDHEDAISVFGIAKTYCERFDQENVLVNSFTSFTDLV